MWLFCLCTGGVRSSLSPSLAVAGYLWTKGWAERNGGNISVNVTALMSEEAKNLPALAPSRELVETVPCLGGNFFYVTGTGKRMRYVAQAPFENGSIIRISPDGTSFGIIAEQRYCPPATQSCRKL